MLAQKTFIKKTRRGNIIKVVREHYLRYLPLHYPAPFAVFFWAHLIVQGRYLVWGRRLCPLWSRWARIDFKQSKGHRSQPDRKQMWKFWPFSPWNMILWCTKHISFHCEGAEKCIFHALFMITNRFGQPDRFFTVFLTLPFSYGWVAKYMLNKTKGSRQVARWLLK